jgi:NAD(P)-dependent dehydrogenase (short-subunit alcohol dehydrogenase family)
MFDYRSMFDLTGKKALVVGAGRGIGEAGAHGLAAFGAEVSCADVDRAAAENTVEGTARRAAGERCWS